MKLGLALILAPWAVFATVYSFFGEQIAAFFGF